MARSGDLAGVFAAWTLARQRATKLSTCLESEELADEQFDVQQACLQSASRTRSKDLGDVVTKLEMYIEETAPVPSESDEMTDEARLLVSIHHDLLSMLGLLKGAKAA